MKIGVISDTHIPAAAGVLPRAVFDIFKDVELILHAGDIVTLEVLDQLETVAPVEAVAGNMDEDEVRLRLPHKKTINIGKYTVGLTHGKYKIERQQSMIRQEFGKVDLIVYGHSHTPFWGMVDGVYFLNPGSPTDKRYAPYNSVAILYADADLKAEIIRL